MRLPDPREFSFAWTLFYCVALLTGALTLIYPPRTLENELGFAATASMGGLLLGGAIVAMFGGALELAKLERTGVKLQMVALIIYASVVTSLHFISAGNRLTQLGVILLALISLVIRLMVIKRQDKLKRITSVG